MSYFPWKSSLLGFPPKDDKSHVPKKKCVERRGKRVPE